MEEALPAELARGVFSDTKSLGGTLIVVVRRMPNTTRYADPQFRMPTRTHRAALHAVAI
jgi:hypothetical protein